MDKQIIAIETPLYLFPFIRLTRTLCIDLNILNLCLNIDTVQFLYNAIGMDNVVNELYYKGTISQRNYRKMTISWSFSYRAGEGISEPLSDILYNMLSDELFKHHATQTESLILSCR